HWNEWRDLVDPGLARQVERARSYTGFEVTQAHRQRAVQWDTLQRFFERYDALLTPTLPVTAFEIALDRPPDVDALSRLPSTYPFNLNGEPAISVPCCCPSHNLQV